MHSTGSETECKVYSEGIVLPDDQLMKEVLGCAVCYFGVLYGAVIKTVVQILDLVCLFDLTRKGTPERSAF